MSVRIKAFVAVYAVDKQNPPENTFIELRSTTLGDKCCQVHIGGHEYLVQREDLRRAVDSIDSQRVY